jgi:hypothetical protein
MIYHFTVVYSHVSSCILPQQSSLHRLKGARFGLDFPLPDLCQVLADRRVNQLLHIHILLPGRLI